MWIQHCHDFILYHYPHWFYLPGDFLLIFIGHFTLFFSSCMLVFFHACIYFYSDTFLFHLCYVLFMAYIFTLTFLFSNLTALCLLLLSIH